VFDAIQTNACSVLQKMEHFEVRNMIKHTLRNHIYWPTNALNCVKLKG